MQQERGKSKTKTITLYDSHNACYIYKQLQIFTIERRGGNIYVFTKTNSFII